MTQTHKVKKAENKRFDRLKEARDKERYRAGLRYKWASGRWKVQMTASKLARKKQDNEIFDAKMKKKESERYWRAKDCRPPRPNKSSDLSQIVKLYQDLPARIQEILVNHREDE